MSDSINALINAQHSSSVLGAIANPAQVNVLGAYAGAARTADEIWGVRQKQANQLAGQAAQGAIDPATGEYSPTQFRTLLNQAGPGAALAAQQGLLNNQSLSNDQLTQAFKKLDFVQTQAGALLRLPEISDADILGTFQKGIASGVMTMPEVMRQMQQVPADQEARRKWAEQHQFGAMTTQQQLEQTYGTRPQVDTGSNVQFPIVPPARSGAAGPVISHGLSPAEKVQTQPTISGSGQKGNVPVGSRFDEQGNLKPPGWGLNGGKYPQPEGTAQNQPPGFQPTEQPPGAEAATTAGNAIYSQADQATMQKSQLLTMESDLKGISTGPVAERSARWSALAHQLGVPVGTMSPDDVAKSESFAKVAKQIALAQAGALGVGTDEKLTTTMGANPNRDLSTMGNKQIIAMLQGNADAIKARGVAYDAWLKAGNNPAQANQFLTQFNRTFDPRVYQWQYQIKDMTEAQRKAAFDALPDKNAFRAKYNDAVRQKLIEPQ
jgi:hypothetical protein